MSHPFHERQAVELAQWLGVTWVRDYSGKHERVVLRFGEASRFVVYPTSPSDGRHGLMNHIGDLRAALRELGAIRAERAKSQAPRRERNRTEPARVVIAERCAGGPRRDPWAPLMAWIGRAE